MHRKVICTRPAPHDSELTADGEAHPRLCTGDHGNALSPFFGGADAKQPGETASRLLRIVPAGPEKIVNWNSFTILKSLYPTADFPAAVSRYLLDMDLHLLQIARLRAGRDFAGVERNAQDIGRIAGNLGAVHVRVAAQLLEDACLMGDDAATYDLISALSRSCDEARRELDNWLSCNCVIRGP